MKRFILPALMALSAFMFQACTGNHNTGGAEDNKSDTNEMAGDTARKGPAAANNDVDAVFAKQAAINGMADITLAKLALTKTVNARIKDFADMIVVDHKRIFGELTNLVRTKSINLPAAMDAQHRQTADSLSRLSQPGFDKAFARVMAGERKNALDLMLREAKNGEDADLKTFAAATAPVIKTQLDSISKIKESLK
jgi:putative membrane protein